MEPNAPAKSLSREETFPRDLHGDAELERELMALAIRVASDLRRQGLRARTVTVKIKDADFRSRTASRTVDQPLESDRAILTVARDLLATLRARRRTGARLVGVGVSHFATAEEGTQLVLFDEDLLHSGGAATGPGVGAGDESGAGGPDGARAPLESDRDRELSRVADRLRERFGPHAIRPGRLLDDD